MSERLLFNRIALSYNSKDDHPVCIRPRMHRLLATVIDIEIKNKSLLEVGCGAGHSVKYLPMDYSNFTGIDFSEKLINLAINQYGTNSCNIDFINTSLEKFDSRKKFDVIFMVGVLHHVKDTNEFISKLLELSHEETIFAFNEPMHCSFIISYFRRIRKLLDNSYSNEQFFFKKVEILSMLQKHRFDCIKIKNQGFLSTPFAEVKLRPILIFYPLSLLSVFFDKLISKLPNSITQFFSWNVVVVAKKLK